MGSSYAQAADAGGSVPSTSGMETSASAPVPMEVADESKTYV